MSDNRFAHVSETGQAVMVDVGEKNPSQRTAHAEAVIILGPTIAAQLQETGAIGKGNVLETARIAGIMAAKRTSELIPMCHPLMLNHVGVDIEWQGDELRIESSVRCQGVTGVEMEALTAASVTALTIYDMCKSAGKGIIIKQIRLLTKTGGKSGDWTVDDSEGAS